MAEKSFDSEIDELCSRFQISCTCENEEPIHLLMVGMPGSGKSSLASVFVNGKSEGISGPEAGTTKLIESMKVKANGMSFLVHDTRGLDVFDKNLKSNIEEMKKIASKENCVVVVCIPFNSRLVNHKLALRATNELSSEIWKKAIIALTHSDRIPNDEQDSINSEWRKAIEEELKRLQVNNRIIEQLKICNTSDTTVSYHQNWFQLLLEKVFEIIPNSNGLRDFLLSRVLIPENISFIEFVWKSAKEKIISIIEGNASAIVGFCSTAIFSNIGSIVVAIYSANPVAVAGIAAIGGGIIFAAGVAIALYFLYKEWKKKQTSF